MPRQRAAISLQSVAIAAAMARTPAATPSQNSLGGAGAPDGDDGGTGDCGTNATVSALQNCGGILIKTTQLEEQSSEFTSYQN